MGDHKDCTCSCGSSKPTDNADALPDQKLAEVAGGVPRIGDTPYMKTELSPTEIPGLLPTEIPGLQDEA